MMENTANETPEVTVEHLQKENESLRRKNRNLANQAARLGEALDAALRVNNDRTEADMFGVVNSNNADRKAREEKAAADRKAREERAAKVRSEDEKLSKSYMRACTINAVALISSVTLAGCTIILGHIGAISPEWATGLSAVFLPLTGWAAHDCKILFQFAGSIRG